MRDHVYPITKLDDERVSIYTKYRDAELLHINEPKCGYFIAETPVVIERVLDHFADPISFFAEENEYNTEAVRNVIDKAGDGVDVYTAPLSVIREITGYNLTRGLLAAFERPALPDAETMLASASCVAVLEETVNPTNVGAIFRSAAALGVDAVLLTHGTTDPLYRRASRVSMGTVFQIPWTYVEKDRDFIELLHGAGFTVISMELTEDAVPLTDPVLKENGKRAIVFGTEGAGVKKETLLRSDHIAVIPMFNGVDSLNVAASSAVTFWELCGK